MKQLNLRLVKQWFDMTLSGVKKEEYREISLHFLQRFVDTYKYPSEEKGERQSLLNSMLFDISNRHSPNDVLKAYYSTIKQFDTTKFTNGYNPTSRAFTIECKGVSIGMGNPEWGAPTDREVFIIEHGAVLEVFNIDFEKEVKRIYPDAYCIKVMTVFFVKEDEYGNMSSLSHSIPEAWQSAYFQLLKQGKI